jgi:hypothetical protein
VCVHLYIDLFVCECKYTFMHMCASMCVFDLVFTNRYFFILVPQLCVHHEGVNVTCATKCLCICLGYHHQGVELRMFNVQTPSGQCQ